MYALYLIYLSIYTKKGSMFGYYNVPLELAKEGISVSLESDGEGFMYRSECAGMKVEKIILARTGKVLINPVEPLNTPKVLTSALLIEFEKSLLVEPKATRKIIITYPIEIGVFISAKNARAEQPKNASIELLDILTLAKQKFTLYGNPRKGVICKYWRSKVHASIPAVNPLHEGVIELSITNTTPEWVEVTKAVFNAYGMKIYYNDDLVAMKATMKLLHGHLAETDFVDAPLLEAGMTKSLELYTAKKLPVVITKFVMEEGL